MFSIGYFARIHVKTARKNVTVTLFSIKGHLHVQQINCRWNLVAVLFNRPFTPVDVIAAASMTATIVSGCRMTQEDKAV